MKLVIIILIAGLMQVSAASFGQKVSLSEKNATLSNIFQKMRAQTGYDFLFDAEVMRSTKRVNVNFKNVPLSEALEKCLEGQDLEFTIEAQSVIVRKKEKSFLDKVKDVTLDLFQGQAIDVRGKVVDSLGNGLPGATVSIKGTNKSTQTTQNGEFYIKGVDEGAVFVVTYLGYVTKKQEVYKDYNYIRMSESTSKLDEVQIQAYGMTTRRLNTGNISTVKSKDIVNDVVSDPILALKGKVPGLTIQQTTGVPGGEVKINIRGYNSMFSGNEPLVLVDGMPFESNVDSYYIGAKSAFTFINPNDIESVDVLKDASATAIYGSRGANGVILITTKKGKSGAANIDLKMQHGVGEVAKKRNLLNTAQYLEMRKEAFANDGIIPSDDPLEARLGYKYAPDLTIWDQTAYTDWQKEFLGESNYTNFQGNVTGAGTNYNYLISGNYNRETTIFPGESKFETGRIRFTLSNTSNNGKFKSNIGGGFSTNKSFIPGQDFINYFDLPPNAPNAFNPDGTLNWALNPKTGTTTWPESFNPYSRMLNDVQENRNNNLIGNIDLSYLVLPGLDIKVTTSLNQMTSDGFGQQLIEGVEPIFRSMSTASGIYTDLRNFSWQVEPLASYQRKIWKGDFSLIGGVTLQSKSFKRKFLSVSGIRDDAYVRNPAAGTDTYVLGSNSDYRYSAYYGRMSYFLFNRYLLDGTIRKDGSSRFGPNKQFKQFGALGAGWIFSEESIIKDNLSLLSFGKIRASWGVTGNDQIGDYKYLNTYVFPNNLGAVPASYQEIRPLRVTGLYNPNYGWERSIKTEYGLELGFFKDRILMTASIYKNKSDNQLLDNELPSYVGFPSVTGNIAADMENTGQEYTLTSRNLSTETIDWTSILNVSVQRNKLLNYSRVGLLDNVFYERLAMEGRSIRSIRLYQMTHLDPETGTYQFIDPEGNSNNAFSAKPDASLLDPTPRYYGGLQNNIRYKNFQFDISLQFVRQKGINSIYNNGRGSLFMPGTMRNQDIYVLKRWQKQGDLTDVKKFSQNTEDFLSVFDYDTFLRSDANYGDASFIRCNNISLSWGLPKKALKKMGLVNCRISLQGQNLFTITNYKGWDPENQSTVGIPPLRIFTTGLLVSF